MEGKTMRFGPHVRLELDAGRTVMRYLRKPGQEELEPLELHPLLAVVLSYLDRGWTHDALAQRLSRRLAAPIDAMREISGDAQYCFQKHFQNESEASFVEIGETERLLEELAASGAAFRSRDVVFPGDRAHFPLTLQWLVTRYCNRNCIYCYQGATPNATARDAEISADRVREILREGARLGAFSFFLTGGEPLLRDDVYELVCDALALGMTPKIITKQFIPEDAAAKLSAAGLRKIALSIDSLEPAVAARMTRVRTFARDIRKTVTRLVERDVEIEVRTVLTTENLESVPSTMEELERLGVSEARIDAYSPNLKRHSDRLMVTGEQLGRIGEWVRRFNARPDRAIKVLFAAEPQDESRLDPNEDAFLCHNGVTTLLFLPDGRVSRCDKPLPGDELLVGDLRRQSVHEVWSSKAMLDSLKPSRELYRGTPCHDCGRFDVCHERGRCFYSAFMIGKTLFGPQDDCPFLDRSELPVVC